MAVSAGCRGSAPRNVGAHGRAPVSRMACRPTVSMQFPNRRSVRLKTHDYRSSGPYFLTLCSFEKRCSFGAFRSGVIELTAAGQIVYDEWKRIAKVRPEVILDEFVVMPNHLHGIAFLGPTQTDHKELVDVSGRSPRSLGSLIAGYKSACTVRINTIRGTPCERVWQKSFYERVIRSEEEMERIRKYIRANPSRWGPGWARSP